MMIWLMCCNMALEYVHVYVLGYLVSQYYSYIAKYIAIVKTKSGGI